MSDQLRPRIKNSQVPPNVEETVSNVTINVRTPRRKQRTQAATGSWERHFPFLSPPPARRRKRPVLVCCTQKPHRSQTQHLWSQKAGVQRTLTYQLCDTQQVRPSVSPSVPDINRGEKAVPASQGGYREPVRKYTWGEAWI